MEKRNEFLRSMVETSLLVAAAYILSLIKLWEMPFGGSVTAVSMLPLVFIGLRRGPKWGFAGCLVYGLIDFVLGKTYSIHIASILGDYILAWGAMGVAGFFKDKKHGVWMAIPAACFARFVFVFATGVTIWAEYTPEGMPVWLYSLTYNGGYIGVEMVLMFAVCALIGKQLPRLTNPTH
ncbi:MAG: energy-coupled thiamine transporter ThiT [Clostridiales bacterium]|nr:energy-coupled thiamine transporter ThiT [Clostridiales bacterium]